MAESGDYFAWLDLAPGVYSERELADRLAEVRRRESDESRLAGAAAAYDLLCDRDRQGRCLRELAEPAAADRPPAGPAEPHVESAFTAAVASLLEGDSGLLRYSNRRRLLDLAARLGIPPFEANLLIERTRFRVTQRPAWQTGPAGPPPARPRRLTRWLLAIGLALALDLAALILLLR